MVEDGRLRRAWGTQRDVTAEVEAREQAEAGNRAKDEFLAMLGHELRNPLSPILTALELMQLRDAEALRDERAIIERQVEHVVRLVDDLLDVSRITRGMVSLERGRVDLAKVVERAIELASPLLEQHAHRLSVDVPAGLVVDGDPLRLAQVFANLLTNAAKYTPREGPITIAGEREGDRARVLVRDTGIGIRPAMLPKIFDLFVQERQALDRAEGGLGLGLSIVRSLVELHGGKVEAHSEGLGRGSEFRVFLPLSAARRRAPAATARSARCSARPKGMRVLVVDDNEDAAESARQGAERLGPDCARRARRAFGAPHRRDVHARPGAARHRPARDGRLRARAPAACHARARRRASGRGDRLRSGRAIARPPNRPASTSTWSSLSPSPCCSACCPLVRSRVDHPDAAPRAISARALRRGP